MTKGDRFEKFQDLTKDLTRVYDELRRSIMYMEKYMVEEKRYSGMHARRLLKRCEASILNVRREIMPKNIEDVPFKNNSKNIKLLNNFGTNLRSKEYLSNEVKKEIE